MSENKYSLFGLGNPIKNSSHFTSTVYVKEILDFDYPMLADTVTFPPSVRNSWHIHKAGQILMVTNGKGWYQEFGKKAQLLSPGDIVKIPAGIKHWHGATKDSWFTHIALEDWSKGEPEWFEAVSDKEYEEAENNE